MVNKITIQSTALQVHLKNVLQALVSHATTWQLRQRGHFQYSFGCGPSGCGLPRPHHSPILSPKELVGCVPKCAYEGDRREAAAAMLAAQSGVVASDSQPISLFHVRDALTVR